MPHPASHSDPTALEPRGGLGLRLAVLTDAHVADVADPRYCYLRATIESVRAVSPRPDLLVFLGDLCAAGRGRDAIRRLLDDLLRDLPCPHHVLRGNTDLDAPPARFADVVHGWLCVGVDTAESTYTADEDQRLDEILRAHPDRPTALMTHYHPEALDRESEIRLRDRLERSDIRELICGHGHRAERRTIGTTTLHLLAPVDPYKPGTDQPGFDLFVLTPEACERVHHPVTRVLDDPLERWLGFALDAACVERDLPSICDAGPLQLLQVKKAQDAAEVQAVAPQLQTGRLTVASLHISTPLVQPDYRVTNRETIDHECVIAAAMGAASVTSHLPTWDARALFDSRDRWRDTETGRAMIDVLSDLWADFWRAGIRIDIENTHWYDPAVYPDLNGEHQTGIRPTHLLAFREHLEAQLRTRCGDFPGTGPGVACCLDIGHALTNGPLANRYILTDWFDALDTHIASFHLHDVTDEPNGGRQGHHPLGVRNGLVNLEGFLSLKQRHAPMAPAYLEVETASHVLESVAHVRRWFGQRDRPTPVLPATDLIHADLAENSK